MRGFPMQTLLKKFLFTKQILVSEGNAYTEAADVFNAIFAFANLLNIKIVSGRKLATLELLKFAQEELGVDVPEPFYRGFPSSVRKLTPDQLLLDQLVHYALTYGLNDFDGPAGHSIFEGDFERAAFKESKTPVKEFRILTEEAAISELERLVADALASSRPLSATVMEVVTAFVTDYQTTIPACASKDTAARLWLATSSVEFAKFLQLSDVVKVVELVNFETYHSRKIKKLNFANRDRKRIAQLLDTIFARGDVSEKELRECYEKKAIWQGILHHIHYRPRTKQGTEFVALMRGKDNKSAYSEFEGLMSQGKITEAADSLIQSKGVGAFARNFDYIVSRLSDLNELPRLVAKLRSTSLIMQLQLLYHNLDYLSGECQRRVFTFTKFNLLSAHTETDAELLKRKTYLTRGMRQSIVYALYNALRDELKNKLGRVYVDPDAPKVAPPIQETTAASGLGVLPCGTRLPIMRGKKIRAFTYWEKVDDIDISMFGLDADDPSTFDRTVEWVVANRIETVTSHIATPYPGTPFYDRMRREGRIIDDELWHYDTAHVVIRPKNMTPEELYEGYLRVYREVYTLGNIWRRLPRARSQLMPYLLFNLFYRKWGAASERLGQLLGFDRVGALARRAAYFIR